MLVDMLQYCKHIIFTHILKKRKNRFNNVKYIDISKVEKKKNDGKKPSYVPVKADFYIDILFYVLV